MQATPTRSLPLRPLRTGGAFAADVVRCVALMPSYGYQAAISHVIPMRLVQILNPHRWNCNVFEASRKMTEGKLRAECVWRLSRCRPLRPSVPPAWVVCAGSARRVGSLSAKSLPPTGGREGPGAYERVSTWPSCFARADCGCGGNDLVGQGWQLGPCAGSVNPFMRTWALLVERGQGCPCSTYRVNVRMMGPRHPPVRPILPPLSRPQDLTLVCAALRCGCPEMSHVIPMPVF